jgi:CTP synthase
MSYWKDQENQIQKREGDVPMGGTMRLGAYPCVLNEPSLAWEAYQVQTIQERHRHRYEFNNAFLDVLTEKGLIVTGKSPDGELVEIVEIKDHPWFLGCQFHPEFKSVPRRPHPLFVSFIRASLNQARGKKSS